MKLVATLLTLTLLLAVPSSDANHNSLHVESSGGGGNSTSNSTTTSSTSTTSSSGTVANSTKLFGGQALVCFEDKALYGFCSAGEVRRRSITANFYMIVVSFNGSTTYRVLIDGDELELGNGEDEATVTNNTVIEYFEVPAVSRAHLVVELERDGKTLTLDYGNMRLRTPRQTADDGEESPTERAVEKLKEFTPTEFRTYNIKVGLIGLAALVVGSWVGRVRGREVDITQEVARIAE